MAVEDVSSPPYPGEGVTVNALYAAISAVRVWADGYRAEHNAAAGTDVVPPLRPLPDFAAYSSQPVAALFGHLVFVRRLREEWDHLVRRYESAWDDASCVRGRVVLLQSAAVFVNDAFTPFEHREAAGGRDMRRMQKMFDAAQDVVDAAMCRRDYDPELGESAADD